MSVHDILMFFVPVFLLMIFAENYVGGKRGLKLYTLGESFASITIGIVQRLMSFLSLGLLGGVMWFAYENRLFELSAADWWFYPLIVIAVEFAYYWFHRLSHEVRWMWATHSVHHSIEEMNVLAAYRFGWTGWLSMGGIVYIPLNYIGFHPAAITITIGLNLMYQAWLHTTLIPKIRWMEGIFNTPSAHRVHHARNADYLDRNHGGVLLIFDRLFGTYVAERDDEPVEFGLISPSNSHNPVKIAFHEWGNMLNDLRANPIWTWPGYMFGPPGWAPNGAGNTSKHIREAYRREKGLDIETGEAPQTDDPLEPIMATNTSASATT